MITLRLALIISVLLFGLNLFLINAFAQNEIKPVQKVEEKVKEITKELPKEVKEAEKKVVEQKAPTPAAATAKSECACDKPAKDALHLAYESLEEDEWADAITTTKKTITTIETLQKTCNCPVISSYLNVAKAYLNYAQGGQILDGDADIDCTKSKKLYEDAIKTLKEEVVKISDETLKTEAENIRVYSEEESSFVDDECK